MPFSVVFPCRLTIPYNSNYNVYQQVVIGLKWLIYAVFAIFPGVLASSIGIFLQKPFFWLFWRCFPSFFWHQFQENNKKVFK